MNKNIDKDNLNEIINISKKILKIFYLLIIVMGAYILLKIVKELNILGFFGTILKILLPLFIGIVVAWFLNPFVKWLETKKVRRSLGVAFSYIILIGILFLIIKAIIPLLYNQTIELVENMPGIFSDIKGWLQDIFGKFNSNIVNFENVQKTLVNRLDEMAKELPSTLPNLILDTISSVISSVGTFIIGLVIGFFLLLNCNNISNTLLEMIPKKYRIPVKELSGNINTSLRGYANGALIDAFVVFVVSTIAFAIIGLKAPILFGLFCGLMNVIPYAGPYIGGAPAVIVAFSQGTGLGIAVLIAIIIIQSIEGNFLQTLIISKTTKLNPVTIIIGLLIFGHFFGIFGMLLSTPIIGVGKVIIKYFDDKYNFLNFN